MVGKDYIETYNKWANGLSRKWVSGEREAVLNEMFGHTPEKAAFAALEIYHNLMAMMEDTKADEFSLAIRERLTPEGVLTLKVEH